MKDKYNFHQGDSDDLHPTDRQLALLQFSIEAGILLCGNGVADSLSDSGRRLALYIQVMLSLTRMARSGPALSHQAAAAGRARGPGRR